MTISLKSTNSGTVTTCDDAIALARHSKIAKFWSFYYKIKCEVEYIIYKLLH
jgi:hypothetical protein